MRPITNPSISPYSSNFPPQPPMNPMKHKTFTYLNHQFQPLEILPKNFDFFKVTRECRSIGISNYICGKYSHTEFYRQAKTIQADKVDLFLMNNEIIVVPCENELFGVFRPNSPNNAITMFYKVYFPSLSFNQKKWQIFQNLLIWGGCIF
jgi:hypothetical protein